MYKAIIIEDEPPAARRLTNMLAKCHKEISVVGYADSIKSTVTLLQNSPAHDLIFMDVQLGDGLSFDIWKQVEVARPVIFTTAYDDYTLDAFKVNSIDYLLKPIDQEDLDQSITQYHTYGLATRNQGIKEIVTQLDTTPLRQRFLVKKGNHLTVVSIDQVAYLYSEDGYTHLVTSSGHKHLVDQTLDALSQELEPSLFYRISRKMIVSALAITSIHPYLNSRLKLHLSPTTTVDTIVSRDRVRDFKAWLDA